MFLLQLKKEIYLIFTLYVWGRRDIHVSHGAHGGQRHWTFLELELQPDIKCLIWGPGTKLRAPVRAVRALTTEPLLQSLLKLFYKAADPLHKGSFLRP